MISIVSGAFSYMRPGGAFYQFTYGMRCPVRRPILDRLGLRATLIDRAIFNDAAGRGLQTDAASAVQIDHARYGASGRSIGRAHHRRAPGERGLRDAA